MYYIQFLLADMSHPAGTFHQAIFRDLKTLRGVHNRIKTYNLPDNAKYYRVFHIEDEAHFYNEASHSPKGTFLI